MEHSLYPGMKQGTAGRGHNGGDNITCMNTANQPESGTSAHSCCDALDMK